MLVYILKLFFFILVSFSSIFAYYSVWFHNEKSAWVITYLIVIFLVYLIYKSIKQSISKDKIEFTPAWIIWYSILHIFIVSILFFNLSWTSISIVLFFKILGFLILPTIMTFIFYSFGNKLLNLIPSFWSEKLAFKFSMSIGLGFVILSTLITIFGSLGYYNLTTILSIFIIFWAISYKEIFENIKSLWNYKIEFNRWDKNGNFIDFINFPLISAEISFIVLTFLIWVNLVNIVRPMPIWWDDLGVYMNYPKMFAASGEILSWVGLMAWQSITWIGYLFWQSATQAFFINQLGWILSVIVLVLVFWDLLNNSKKRLLSIPIILATIFYSMPMVIFQQAKDMKLDPALFFVSVIWIYLIYSLFSRYLWYEEVLKKEEKQTLIESTKSNISIYLNKFSSVFKSNTWESGLFERKEILIYLFIIWTIVGLAFAIKVTTLMLILGVIWVMFYSKLGFSWFIAYFFMFIWVFTRFKLWDFMNVNYPKDNISLINNFANVSILISVIIFVYSFIKYWAKSFKTVFVLIIIFSSWIAVSVAPWLVKNISELSETKLSIWTMLWWEFKAFKADYKLLYSQYDLDKIEEKNKYEAISSSGKASNEDLWRYFWYEDGINNYLKLPYNLTMQTNQSWEYTDITYLYLALIPALLIFLYFKNPIYLIWIITLTWFGFIYYWKSWLSESLSNFFATKFLPEWYIWIIAIFILTAAFFLYSLWKDKLSQIFKINVVFTTMYVLIFTIAAYWIVWYWISMYFAFLLIIWIGASYLSETTQDDNDDSLRLFGAFIFLLIVFVYFFKSSIPHWVANLRAAWFVEYKKWIYNQEQAIFASHPDYFAILTELNIKNQDSIAWDINSNIKDNYLKQIIKSNISEKPSLTKLEWILREIISADLSKLNIPIESQINIKIESREILNKIYNQVLYPTSENRNTQLIYRIWTFLTYFISDNRSRYYDDSLVMQFGKYFADENGDIAIERMKKLGLKYLLVDLNAATIDKDPRHDLTSRYEKLLSSFTSDKLELIQTDSICLRIALEEKNEKYMTYAWVNYESYTSSWTINRWEKQIACYNHILDLMKENKITDTNYSYLKPIAQYFQANKINDQATALRVFQQYVTHGWLALFRIK